MIEASPIAKQAFCRLLTLPGQFYYIEYWPVAESS